MKLKFFISFLFTLSCNSFKEQKIENPIEKINQQTDLSELLDLSLTYGDEVLLKSKKIISKKGLWPQTGASLRSLLLSNLEKWPSARLINGFILYQSSGDHQAWMVFQKASRSDRVLAQDMAWQLAGNLPSHQMAKEIEARLNEALIHDEVKDLLMPSMAEALGSNQLKSAYSFLKKGLFETSHHNFAEQMARLNPKQAASDFLDYLAQAPLEELRQLNLKSVDLLTCVTILEQMKITHPSVSHPRFESLFFFSISRNAALSEGARNVLLQYLPRQAPAMSEILARQPLWVQLAYVENVRREYTPTLGVLLDELKIKTAQRDVREELNQFSR